MKKQKLFTLISLAPVILCANGCSKKQDVKELASRIFEVETYKKLDYDYADKFWAKDNDNWESGCSAITKMVDGHRLVGRNMDLNISNKCAYFVRTEVGKYDTIGLAYTFRDYSPDYKDVKKHGISKKFSKILPFICDDVMNTEGLHVEVNMRHGERYPNGDDMFAVQSTNPDGERRIHMFELPHYIAENCKTVEEAKEYVNKLNIYSKNGYWNYCFLISDQLGKSSLLEFSDTGAADILELPYKVINWIDEDKIDEVDWLYTGTYTDLHKYTLNGLGQTNFFLNKWAYLRQDTKSGEGRFIAMQEGINDVNSKKDMYDLMEKVSYSHFYESYETCKAEHFDPRSENMGEFKGATYDFMMFPDLEEDIAKAMNAYNDEVNKLTYEQKMDANTYWESTFTEVVDCMDRSIFVRVFEDESMLFKLTFDGFEKTTFDALN